MGVKWKLDDIPGLFKVFLLLDYSHNLQKKKEKRIIANNSARSVNKIRLKTHMQKRHFVV